MTILSRMSTRVANSAALTAAQPLYRLLRLTFSRFYADATCAAAAQPYFDDDYRRYNYLYDSRCDQLVAAPLEDSDGSFPIRGLQLVFIGSPGAKKHVYAEKLSKLLEVPHVSMASLVRQELSPRSSLYRQIANAVNCGKLVPEDIIFGFLSKRLEDGYYRGESGFILDGIPRSLTQAKILDQLTDIDLVVNFKCSESCLVKHHKDSEGSRKQKLLIYTEQSKPLEDYYQKQNKLVDVQVGSVPGETWQGLLAALHISI